MSRVTHGQAPSDDVATLPSASVFVAERYGAVGDNVTDDGPALQATVTAAIEWAVANDGQATVYFEKPGPYLVAGPLQQSVPSAYGQIVMPYRDETTQRKITLRFKGSGPLTPVHGAVSGGTTIRSTRTGAAYHATYGWPAVFAGADFDKVVSGNGKFSAYHVIVEDVYVLLPDDPSLAAWNLSGTATCELPMAGGGTPSIPAVQPTHPTGVGIYWPQGDNHALIRGTWYGAGLYANEIVGEHSRARTFAYQCFLAHGFRNYPGGHGFSRDSQVEWCPYGIAGLDPVAGIVSATPSNNFGPGDWKVRFEDAHAGSPAWTTAVAHVVDLDGALKGSLRYTHWILNTGASTVPIVCRGGNLALQNLIVNDRQVLLRKSFIGANSALAAGPAETGQAETVYSGVWGISNNQGYLVSAIDGTYFDAWESSAADGEAEWLVQLSATRAGPLFMFRGSSATNLLALQLFRAGATDQIGLYKIIGGVTTLLKEVSPGGLVLGRMHSVRVRYVGQTVTVWVAGPGRANPFVMAVNVATGQEAATKVGIGNGRGNPGDDGATRFVGPMLVRQPV